MKKLEVISFLFVLFFIAASPVVLAFFHNNEDEQTNQDSQALPALPTTPAGTPEEAYSCLEKLIDDKSQEDLSLQEAVFSTLALGKKQKLVDVIKDSEKSNCWPDPACTVKETAQVLLAYDRIKTNTQNTEYWLLNQTGTASELTWFLQIDIANHESATCILGYQDAEKKITINEDMTISGNPGACFTISSSGFWLKTNNNCVDQTFRVSCSKDFITSLLYQKTGSSTIFVSPNTHSQAALGTTEEKINSKCFKKGNICNYEGSLWAALALDKTGNDVTAYLPYLFALAKDNQKLFPSAFLYSLAKADDQYSEIIQSQQQNQYWQAQNTLYNRFYDTALGMLSLQDSSATELTNAQNYLLQIQTPEGCWNNNNIRDTAFLLYAGWPKSVSKDGGGTGGTTQPSCISQGYECISSLFTCSEVGGDVLDFDCDVGICCSASLQIQTCAEQDGIICSASQTCSGTVVDSLDGSCCLDSCQELPQADECQNVGGGCFTSCTKDEEQLPESCSDSSLVCCKAKEEAEGGTSLWVWIIILLILIVLVVLGIIYRKKLILWLHKLIDKIKKGRQPPAPNISTQRRPPYPPYGPAQLRRPMQMPPSLRGPIPTGSIKPAKTKTDKELEETLNKLKEMSK